MTEHDQLRYFEEFPRCMQCGKIAHGNLRGNRNESYGPHCMTCANKRLKASKAVRDQARKEDE